MASAPAIAIIGRAILPPGAMCSLWARSAGLRGSDGPELACIAAPKGRRPAGAGCRRHGLQGRAALFQAQERRHLGRPFLPDVAHGPAPGIPGTMGPRHAISPGWHGFRAHGQAGAVFC